MFAQAGSDLSEPLFARSAARFLLHPERSIWSDWINVHGRALRPEVLRAIERVLARKARVVPRRLLQPVPVPAEDAALVDA